MSTEKAVDTAEPPQEVYDLLLRTNKKKPAKKDVEAMQTALREYPGLWRRFGDFARHTQYQLIDKTPASEVIAASYSPSPGASR